jgi:serine/threonine protein kinase
MPVYDGSLRNLINKGIPPDQALDLFRQAVDGIKAAHEKKVWHRDLKPENLLYDAEGKRLLVADFGIAHFHEEALRRMDALTPKDARVANRDYAAPEQRRKGKTVDGKADIYALGIILNELFTRDMGFGTDHIKISYVAPKYRHLDKLVRAMMHSDPDKRPGIREVRAALGHKRGPKQKARGLV